MKKLMMALAVVATTAAVNASTFSWGLTSGSSFDTEKFASGTAYLFYGSNGSTPSLPNTTAWAAKTLFTYDDLVGSGATLLTSATITDGLFSGSNLSSYGELVPNDVGAGTANTKATKFYMAVISDDGKNVAVVNNVLSKTIAKSTTVASATWSSSSVTTYTASVPEPTSGLMLLLGMAGLALKRKRA